MSFWKNLGGDPGKRVHSSTLIRRPDPSVESPAGARLEERTRRSLEEQTRRQEGGIVANIGKSIAIKGDVSGQEDLVIEGRVEGRISLDSHHLTIGPNGEIQAEITAKQVTIIGRVVGNVTATERVEICDTGRLQGDLSAPRLLVHEGAVINGTVGMKPRAATASEPERRSAGGAKPKIEAVPKAAS